MNKIIHSEAFLDKYYNTEASIIVLEHEIIPDLEEKLAYLTSPEYDSEGNPDHEYLDADIESLSAELVKETSDLLALVEKFSKMNMEISVCRNLE